MFFKSPLDGAFQFPAPQKQIETINLIIKNSQNLSQTAP